MSIEFEPNAVLIPKDAVDKRSSRQVTVDPEMCTLLYLDGDRLSGHAYTKEAWATGRDPEFFLRDDMYYRTLDETPFCRAGLSISDQEPVDGDRIQLLPDMWVLKVEETEYWELADLPSVRVFGVYVLNKRKVNYLCEMTPSYELYRFDSQWDMDEEPLPDDPHGTLAEKIGDAIRDGERGDEDVIYVHVSDVEKQLKEEIRKHAGALPSKGSTGGYRWTDLEAVTEEDALEEIRESQCNGDL